MKFATKAVRAGIKPDPTTGAIVPPIYQTATYVLEEVGKNKGFDYTRASNPTRAVLEENLAALDGGKYGVSFASGLSAVDAVTRSMLSPGDHVVSSDDVYGGVSRMFNQIHKRFGLEFTYVDSSTPENVEKAIRPETKMIWLETPTNPLLRVTDLEAVARIGKAHGIPTAVDPTFATPALLRPLEFGIDIVVHSTTKYLSGHNQIIGGVVITNNEEYFQKFKFFQKSIGAVSSPFDCWLTLLGVKTLPLRMEKHSANGMVVAKYLEEHPKVDRVSYPGLPSHPQHGLAQRQMQGFGGMVTAIIRGGLEPARRFLERCRIFALAESLGGVESLIEHPGIMTHASIPAAQRAALGIDDGLVRLSVGVEEVGDLIDDLGRALGKF